MLTIKDSETVMRYGEEVSKQKVFKEYLENDFLDMKKVINENVISIASDNTTFINHQRITFVDEGDFLEVIKKLSKVARENKVKLKNVNKLRTNIKEYYYNYESNYSRYDRHYRKLARLWDNYTLRKGYSNDFYYEEVLRPLGFELNFYKLKSIYEPLRTYENILDYTDMLEEGSTNYTQITLNSLDILKD